MPFLESNLVALLRATGGVDGGLTARELAELVHAPEGRVRMTLRRLLDRGVVVITAGSGSDARYLLSDMRGGARPPPREDDFGWGSSHTSSPPPSSSFLQAEVARLRREVARLQADNHHLREALTHRGPTASEDLFERLDDLIQLCHPDRHDNNARSNDVTRWLIGLRKRRP